MFRNLVFIILFFSPLAINAQEKLKNTEQFVSKLDSKIPQLLNDFSVPGAAISIIENGEIVLQKGYGLADIEKEVKVTTKTGFNIASISKTITAWGIMKLVEEGKIDLDAPAEKYLTRWKLPDSEFNPNEITIRRLLSHTAGLSLDGYGGWTPEETLPTLEESLNGKTNGSGKVEIIIKPGTKYQYSGGGYTVLQLIIEEVSGQKFEEFMQEQILAPLGMTNSSFKIDHNILAASASEYDNFGEQIPFELFTAQAAAGLHTTIEDFTLFALANLSQNEHWKKEKHFFSPDIVQQMMKPQPSTNEAYGLGYELGRGDLAGLNGHTGGNTGWQSMFKVDPNTNDGFIIFTNGGAGYNIINAVLCEWINWNTGVNVWDNCNLKPSIANKIKQLIDEDGIEEVKMSYMSLKQKQPNFYNFSENQLNNLGYFYLGRKEFEKANAIFKLNVEAFPNSYNVYDSYGETLLIQGFKEKAIENYTKSIKLNPGNQHGIKVLNELGISNDELVNNISVPLDATLLSEYIGRYMSAKGESLNIRLQGSKLIAEIESQEFFLVNQSELRFQTFNEGYTVTFFTAATGQKGLWAKQTIWKKLSENTNENVERHKNGKFLVFRNNPSWNRQTDFENVLHMFSYSYELRESNTMTNVDLSLYDVIIVPGAQRIEYYNDYVLNIKRFNDYVKNGGTLLLELNGAKNYESIILPHDVTLESHKALENTILEPDYPIFLPLVGKPLIQARYASSGYLKNVPYDALILSVESEETNVFKDRPTFIEYSFGKGRVIAAFQCFHDRDDSGRGPLMESVISYAASKSWEKQD